MNNKNRRVGEGKGREEKAIKMESKVGDWGGEKRLKRSAEISTDRRKQIVVEKRREDGVTKEKE